MAPFWKPNTYIIKNEQPDPEPDIEKWGQWFSTDDRIIQQNNVNGIFISTIFLGLDHNFLGGTKPILWETMIFNLHIDEPQWRYDSLEKALKGHQQALRMVDLAIRKKHRRFAMHVPMTGRIITHPISPLWRDWKSWKNR